MVPTLDALAAVPSPCCSPCPVVHRQSKDSVLCVRAEQVAEVTKQLQAEQQKGT
jgi:hypothetical protein